MAHFAAHLGSLLEFHLEPSTGLLALFFFFFFLTFKQVSAGEITARGFSPLRRAVHGGRVAAPGAAVFLPSELRGSAPLLGTRRLPGAAEAAELPERPEPRPNLPQGS